MSPQEKKMAMTLGLRVGDWVEVRGWKDILVTLDDQGKLEGLPFMPEMLTCCGKQFRVVRRIDKTCDTIDKTGMRRMKNVVILEGVRCDGQYHGGCQAACMMFWKEAWLKVIPKPWANAVRPITLGHMAADSLDDSAASEFRTKLEKAALLDGALYEDQKFMCQVTELKKATSELAWWDFRQYWRDIRSGNVGVIIAVRGLLIMLFNWVQAWRGGCPFPYIPKSDRKRTPQQILNLRPGELVRVKSPDEIEETLDENHKNRGLWFDKEMLQYCGQIFRVRGRVNQLINERTGTMIKLSNECIILEDVVCRGQCHKFCPRFEYIYWREIWLDRVEAVVSRETVTGKSAVDSMIGAGL